MVGTAIGLAVLGSGFGPEVMGWKSAVDSALGKYSFADLAALDQFIKRAKADGFWSSIQAIGGFGQDLTAATIALGSGGTTSFTNNNFVAGDYTPTGGLVGNGTSKFLNSGIQIPSVAGFFGAWSMTALTGSSTAVVMGANNSGTTQIYRLRCASGPATTALYGGTTTVTNAANLPVGLNVVERSSTTRLDLYQSGSSVGNSTTSTTGTGAGVSAYVFALNNNGTATSWISIGLGCWIFGSAPIGSTLQSALNSRVTTLMQRLGRA